MITLSQIQFAAMESIFRCTKDDLQGPPTFTEIKNDSERILLPGCHALKIPIVAEFGKPGGPQVPLELVEQICGKTYKPGFTVDYKNKKCLVVGLTVGPVPPVDIDEFLATCEQYHIETGKIIPKNSRILGLSLVDATGLNLNS